MDEKVKMGKTGSEIRELILLVEGEGFNFIYSEEMDEKHMVRITCNYQDGTSKSFWMHIKDIINNIRMKGTSYVDIDGTRLFL